jgi:hypothetical protein
MPLDKKMVITILLSGFRIMVHAGAIMQIIAVVAMDDPSLYPPPGKFVGKQGQNNQAPAEGSLATHVRLKRIVICIPTSIEQTMLALRGEFRVSVLMNSPRTAESLLTELKEKGIEFAEGSSKIVKEAEDMNVVMGISTDIKGLEVFICRSADIEGN